jgi:hypothetical protein
MAGISNYRSVNEVWSELYADSDPDRGCLYIPPTQSGKTAEALSLFNSQLSFFQHRFPAQCTYILQLWRPFDRLCAKREGSFEITNDR